MSADTSWYVDARYGLFIHYGLYSMLGRGEWVLCNERIPFDEYKPLADSFTAEAMDFDALIGRARNEWGMRYACLTTKHHDGFCLYDSSLTDFTAPKTRCGRDLVAEFVAACRKHDMRISLYHSLNDWTNSPNAVDALNRPEECYEPFIDFVHGQIREIMTNYGPVDIMWYDGWWPFDATGWQAEKLNAMVRELQPGVLVNGRCGLPGDFGTPEGHVTDPGDGRPWEACMTLNENWGYHAGDHDWKSARTVAEMLRQCAAGGNGNLLLNVGPRGDGSTPEETVEILDEAGAWLKANEESIRDTERFVYSQYDPKPEERSDWQHSGRFTANENAFFWHACHWPGASCTVAAVMCTVTSVTNMATSEAIDFEQQGDRVLLRNMPETPASSMPTVLRFATEGEPRLYGCGGCTTPEVPHCRYDPIASDMHVAP